MSVDQPEECVDAGIIEVGIQGFPALLIDPATGGLRVNDLRSTEAFARSADGTTARRVGDRIRLVIDPVRGSLGISTGNVTAWIDREPERPTHAVVRAIGDDGVAVLDCVVRFRQQPVSDSCQRVAARG